jgi:hypothetical protein
MRVQDIVGAPKSRIKIGAWHTGKVPKADFPIAKKAYGLGTAFEWCVISFAALGTNFRVLVVLNQSKQKYDAILGASGDDVPLRLLCTYQYHAGEPGWHCHATCGDVSGVPPGIFRGPWVKRIPGGRRPHRRLDFGIQSRNEAIRFAQDAYRIFQEGPLL